MIPERLKRAPHWICWTTENRGADDELTKVPRAPWNVDHTGPASATDPANGTTYETAKEWADKVPGWGLGFAFYEDGPFCGVDLDDCRDPETGDLSPEAMHIVRKMDSFTEVSPSGTGLHILCEADIGAGMKDQDEHIEMYDRERYFTVTGDHLDGSPTEIKTRDGAAQQVIEEYDLEADDDRGLDDYEPRESREAPKSAGGFGEDHPFYNLRVADLYLSKPVGENTAHPEHGSSTGANFKIDENGYTAVCWRAEHADPSNGAGGVGLAAPHLLAMQATGKTHCYRVRQNFRNDDELAYEAWKEAVSQGLIEPSPPIWRAVRHVASTHDIEQPSTGGAAGWAAFRTACRIIRHETGFDITLSDPSEA